MTNATTRAVPAATGFWIVAVVFLTAMAYSTIPTPLYTLYQQRDGFEVWVITMIFAAYAVGVVLSLFFAGHLSDVFGRRRMLVIAVLVSAVSAVMFLVWNDVAGLLAARLVNGVSIGILTATATAHLAELRGRSKPDENPVVAASVAGAANLGGLALGPLIGGFFVEFLPLPLVLPHAVFLVLLLAAAVALLPVPETVVPAKPRPSYRPQRLAFPPGSRPAFVAAGLGAFASFALFGLFTSLAPTFLVDAFRAPSHLLAGATPFAVFASAAIAQVLLARVALRRQLTIAIVSCAVGLVAIAAGAVAPSLALFLLGGIIGGVGVGILFRSAIATAAGLAAPGQRGETLALIFLIAYCGLALPVIAVGVSLLFFSETTVLLVFTALVLVATVSAGIVMRRRDA
ncbi:MFS transporter [Microbacterium sp.]|uniref:MFS transporter n=1 Tax=Microbacterium sp. TaxID=51671 RepID=UPI003F718578